MNLDTIIIKSGGLEARKNANTFVFLWVIRNNCENDGIKRTTYFSKHNLILRNKIKY